MRKGTTCKQRNYGSNFIVFQVVASSLKGAKQLVQLCQNSSDATRVNQGVLIGSGQSHFFLGTNVLPLWITSQIWNPVSLVMHSSVIAVHFCLCIELQWVGNCTEMVMLYVNVNVNVNDTYQLVWNPGGGIMHYPLSDTLYVIPFKSGTIFGIKDLQREIMLFPDVNENFAVVDPFSEPIFLPIFLWGCKF